MSQPAKELVLHTLHRCDALARRACCTMVSPSGRSALRAYRCWKSQSISTATSLSLYPAAITCLSTLYSLSRYCSRTSTNSAADRISRSSASDLSLSLAVTIAQIRESRVAMAEAMSSLLDDRRVHYRDTVIDELLQPHREALQRHLIELLRCRGPSAEQESTSRRDASSEVLSRELIHLMKEIWCAAHESSSIVSPSGQVETLLDFYGVLLSSALIQSDHDIRLVLAEMQGTDLLEPTAAVYGIILTSLLFIKEARIDTTNAEKEPSSSRHVVVVGQAQTLNRGKVGDLAGLYLGHALSQFSSTRGHSLASVADSTWDTFFTICALVQVAPKLMDLWWEKFTNFYDGQVDPTDEGDLRAAPLPYTSVHSVLSWCAANRDLERSMKVFHASNQRGLRCAGNEADVSSGGSVSVTSTLAPGGLTASSTDAVIQMQQLRLLVKMIATAKSIKMDGGMKELFVADVKRLISPDTVQRHASWGVINDLLSGLSMPSAMQLVKSCSSCRNGGDAAVPFLLWASLLRRCARDHHQDEAEALFLFLRRRFPLTSAEKREMVEIMMRMYATLTPPDYASAMHTFLEHVVHPAPAGEPRIEPDAELYKLLIRAADSRNTAMMTFMESCAAGVDMDEETFAVLLASNPYSQISSLSRKLPHDYPNSKLDAQLKIPANVDAHMRREEALRARGKPLYISTGDAF